MYEISTPKNNKRIDATNFITKENELISNSSTLVQELFNILQKYQVPSKAFSVITKNNALAEINSAAKFALSGAISVTNTGSKGAKPDNIIGYISVNTDLLNPLNDTKIKTITDKIIIV